jgi:hypothetical protein
MAQFVSPPRERKVEDATVAHRVATSKQETASVSYWAANSNKEAVREANVLHVRFCYKYISCKFINAQYGR